MQPERSPRQKTLWVRDLLPGRSIDDTALSRSELGLEERDRARPSLFGGFEVGSLLPVLGPEKAVSGAMPSGVTPSTVPRVIPVMEDDDVETQEAQNSDKAENTEPSD